MRGAAAWLVLASVGCAGGPPAEDARRARACDAPPMTAATEPSPGITIDLTDGEPIARVDVRGARGALVPVVLAALQMNATSPFREETAQKAVARVHALGVFEDVRLVGERTPAGLVLTADVRERPFVQRVFLAPGATAPDLGAWVPPLPGDLYDPPALDRAARDLVRTWSADGYLDAAAEARAVRIGDGAVDVCFRLARGPAWTIARIDVTGVHAAPRAELLAQIDTSDGHVNVPGQPYRADLIDESLILLHAVLYDHGLLSSKVGTPVVTRVPKSHQLAIEIPIDEGKVFRVGRVRVTGVADPKPYEALVDLPPGTVFARTKVLATLERLRALHQRTTGKASTAEPDTQLDDARGVVDLDFRMGEPAK